MRRILVGTVAVVALAVVVASASASAPMQATGFEVYKNVFTCDPGPPFSSNPATCKWADGNLFLTQENPGWREGSFTGTQLFSGSTTLFKNGDYVYHGKMTFEGTVAGCGTGTVIFNLEGSGSLATGTTRDRLWATGQGTLKVQANLTHGPSVPYGDPADGWLRAEVTGTYHC